jgi:hypothetical protein
MSIWLRRTGQHVIAQVPTCEVCELRRGVNIRVLPGASHDISICRPCLDAGAIPLDLLIEQTLSLGDIDHAPPWWAWTINDTLEHLRISRTDFENAVEQRRRQVIANTQKL